MKPLRVAMGAFGSYISPIEIDFLKLGENPIFLITGATGGGKTTILDAMCFALYCRATGGRRSWNNMRCTSAPEDAETMVEFDFALGAERFRFHRSRSLYQGRGNSGQKSREEHLCFRWENGDWALLESGAEARVREQAEKLLGLDCEQFSQVVVLPQGDFLKLLLASSKEKAAIFETLFAAGRWAAVTMRLREKASTLEKRANELTAAKTVLLQGENAEDAEGLAKALAEGREALKTAQSELEQKNKLLDAANSAMAAATELSNRFQESEKLGRQQADLDKRLPGVEESRKKLALGRSAAQIYPLYTALSQTIAGQQAVKKRLMAQQSADKASLEQAKAAGRLAGERLSEADKNCRDGETFIAKVRELERTQPERSERVRTLTTGNAASALAAVLQEGQPCPVCGSVHHPAPAAPMQELEAAKAALAEAEKAARTLEKAEERLKERRAQQEAARKALQEAEQRAMALEKQEAVTLSGLASAEEQLAKAQADLAAQEQAFALACPRFRPEEVLLPPERLQALEASLAEFDVARKSVADRISALEKELEGKTPPALEGLREAQSNARGQVVEASRQAGGLAQRLERGGASLEKLNSLEAESAGVIEDYQRTKKLADLLGGKNPRKIPLQQFVLGIMLDDILSCANEYFATFSSGRYSLSRIRGLAGGNAYGGLDLEVLDAQSGGSRAVETLSGGELFLASLSLAFGLSQVVQSYSGSVRLDSIFIDEGFGTLDQETLDTAMRALAQVRQAGRTIGIISHVTELKARIPRQVVVRKGADGGSFVELYGDT